MASIERFQDLDVDNIRKTIAGMILDVDGTLVEHGKDNFSPQVIQKLVEIREKMPVCVFNGSPEWRPVFQQLKIPIVRNVPPKPDPRGFNVAIQLYLQGMRNRSRIIYPQECASIGDDYLTDGSCRKIGMHYIHVKPVTGDENLSKWTLRLFAEKIASIHDLFRKTHTSGKKMSDCDK